MPAWNCAAGWTGVTLTGIGRMSAGTFDEVATQTLPALTDGVTTPIQIIADTAMGENITIVRFARFKIGEAAD